jgi:hypothetical protein
MSLSGFNSSGWILTLASQCCPVQWLPLGARKSMFHWVGSNPGVPPGITSTSGRSKSSAASQFGAMLGCIVGDAAGAGHCRDASSLQLCSCCRSEVAAATESATFTDFMLTEAHPYSIAVVAQG